jgi:formamidopyrimidine-DNA glycosylase
MPELPEVETILRGIKPSIVNQTIKNVTIRHYGLRWPVPQNIQKNLKNKVINAVIRRGKYLIFELNKEAVILHLGMSGTLRILTQYSPPKKHDHIDIAMANGVILRFADPRRFGAFLLTKNKFTYHPLLKNLGPEPLDKIFTGNYLWSHAQNRKMAVKSFIMDNKIVVGVGNIYAAEALFLACINPKTPVNKISQGRYDQLTKAIKCILRQAIKRGGTTLKDFVNSEGKPGYFANQLNVYGRAGMPCIKCCTLLISIQIGQRSTVYCEKCQS